MDEKVTRMHYRNKSNADKLEYFKVQKDDETKMS